jgi:tyrosine-protein phosphatase SIW14
MDDMARTLRVLMGLLIVAIIVGAPLAYKAYRDTQFRNFHVVKEGVLYRSGQMTLDGLKRIIHDHCIKTVVTLRDAYYPDDEPPDKKEEAYCLKEGLSYYRIPPRPWWATDGSVPAEKGVKVFREVMRDPANYPVLVHCFAGIHRTGAYVAVYRMEFEGWSNERAIAEVKDLGYSNIEDDEDVLGFLLQYRPRGIAADGPAATPTVRPAIYPGDR